MQICGAPGLENCSGCGGALCSLGLGKRKCGGPNCDGVVPLSQKASETAKKMKDQLTTLLSRLQESKNKAGLPAKHPQLRLDHNTLILSDKFKLYVTTGYDSMNGN